jgi:hypothetical protein
MTAWSTVFLMQLRRMERGDLTAHAFRSTFRDWCAEATKFVREAVRTHPELYFAHFVVLLQKK